MAKPTQPQVNKHTASMDLSTYSFDELLNLKKQIDSEVEARKSKEIENLRAKVSESAQVLGVTIQEIFQLPTSRREAKNGHGKPRVKYRGPNGEEWSGRGPAPKWLKAHLAKGKSKEDFLVK